MSAPDPVAEVLARALGEHYAYPTGVFQYACRCGDEPENIRLHVAAMQAAALREAGLIPEATTRVEWGTECIDPGCDCGIYQFPFDGAPNTDSTRRILRRTRTTYADRVTEWKDAE